MKAPNHRPGRPQKYGRPTRAVTVSLPEDVLAWLRAVDADLGRAIVTLVERPGMVRPRPVGPAELAAYGNHAVIVVNPARVLKRLPGVELVPTGNGRSLITLEQPSSIPRLELALRDAIQEGDMSEPERQTLWAIADILHQARHSKGVSLKERSIIVIESKRHARKRYSSALSTATLGS